MVLPKQTVVDKILSGSPRNQYRIMVVGNSKVDKDYSELIDSADMVVRFSKVLEYDTGLVGSKTNVVVSRVGAVTVRFRNYFKQITTNKPWHDAEEYWFSGRPCDSDPAYIQTYLDKYTDFDARPMRYMVISPLFNSKFGVSKNQERPTMTSGIVTLLYLLSINNLKDSTIQLVGFKDFYTRPDDDWHDVDMDKRLIQDLHNNKYIELIG